jgi:hypothetical protein
MTNTRVQTPWGMSQDVENIGPGIDFVETAGHGGIRLSADKHADIQKRFPNFETFASGPWYEEDCDICVVVVAFPQYFKPEKVELAKKTILGNKDYYKIDSL